MRPISLIEVAEPVAAPLPAPAGETAPAAESPAAEPAARPARMNLLPIIAVTLAALASFMAVIGLVVANRTVMHASLIVADAQERQEQLAKVSELIGQVDALRLREEAALERADRLRMAGAATPLDVNRAIDNLRQDLAKRSQDGGALGLVRDGQSELAERLGQVSMKLERVEQLLKAGHGPVPKAHP